jgi:RNA polymerase sigma-70 factor, ECF subfamily
MRGGVDTCKTGTTNGRVRNGVTSADETFRALFNAHYGDVLAYAMRRCASRQDAEDVVAETFSVAWRRIADVPRGDPARLWLFVTARRVYLNQERSHRRQRSLAEKVRDALPSRRDLAGGGEASEQERVQQAMTDLAASDREVLQLHVWEELSAEEIAVALDISTSAVWKRLQRARDRLLRALEAQTEGDPSPFGAIPSLRRGAP